MTYVLAPFCFNCGKVKGPDGSIDLEGKPCETVKKLSRCARCLATYCSPECQKANWSEHKRICVEPKCKIDPELLRLAFHNFEKTCCPSLPRFQPADKYFLAIMKKEVGGELHIEKDRYQFFENLVQEWPRSKPYNQATEEVCRQFPDAVIAVLVESPKIAKVKELKRIKAAMAKDPEKFVGESNLPYLGCAVWKPVRKGS